MGVIKISLPIAVMIETLKRNEISDHEILNQIEQKDVSQWEDISGGLDFYELLSFAEQNETAFKSIILEGYSIKFMTIRGLQNLLQLKFDKKRDRDYELTEKGIVHLQVDHLAFLTLKQLLSKNCTIDLLSTDSEETKVINIRFT